MADRYTKESSCCTFSRKTCKDEERGLLPAVSEDTRGALPHAIVTGALYLEDFFLHLQCLQVPLRYQAGKSTHSSCPDRDLGVVG